MLRGRRAAASFKSCSGRSLVPRTNSERIKDNLVVGRPQIAVAIRWKANSHPIRSGQSYQRTQLVSLSRNRVPGGWHAKPTGFFKAALMMRGSGP